VQSSRIIFQLWVRDEKDCIKFDIPKFGLLILWFRAHFFQIRWRFPTILVPHSLNQTHLFVKYQVLVVPRIILQQLISDSDHINDPKCEHSLWTWCQILRDKVRGIFLTSSESQVARQTRATNAWSTSTYQCWRLHHL